MTYARFLLLPKAAYLCGPLGRKRSAYTCHFYELHISISYKMLQIDKVNSEFVQRCRWCVLVAVQCAAERGTMGGLCLRHTRARKTTMKPHS
jgi:hypothetical protein